MTPFSEIDWRTFSLNKIGVYSLLKFSAHASESNKEIPTKARALSGFRGLCVLALSSLIQEPAPFAQGGNSYAFVPRAVGQGNDYFFARKREIFFLGVFFARKREQKKIGCFLDVFWVFLCFLGGVFVLFGFLFLFFAR